MSTRLTKLDTGSGPLAPTSSAGDATTRSSGRAADAGSQVSALRRRPFASGDAQDARSEVYRSLPRDSNPEQPASREPLSREPSSSMSRPRPTPKVPVVLAWWAKRGLAATVTTSQTTLRALESPYELHEAVTDGAPRAPEFGPAPRRSDGLATLADVEAAVVEVMARCARASTSSAQDPPAMSALLTKLSQAMGSGPTPLSTLSTLDPAGQRPVQDALVPFVAGAAAAGQVVMSSRAAGKQPVGRPTDASQRPRVEPGQSTLAFVRTFAAHALEADWRQRRVEAAHHHLVFLCRRYDDLTTRTAAATRPLETTGMPEALFKALARASARSTPSDLIEPPTTYTSAARFAQEIATMADLLDRATQAAEKAWADVAQVQGDAMENLVDCPPGFETPRHVPRLDDQGSTVDETRQMLGRDLKTLVETRDAARRASAVPKDALPALALMENMSRALAIMSKKSPTIARAVLKELERTPMLDLSPDSEAPPTCSHRLRRLFHVMVDIPRGIETLHALGPNDPALIVGPELQALNAYWRADKALTDRPIDVGPRASLTTARHIAAGLLRPHEPAAKTSRGRAAATVSTSAKPVEFSQADEAAYNAVRLGITDGMNGATARRHDQRMRACVAAYKNLQMPGSTSKIGSAAIQMVTGVGKAIDNAVAGLSATARNLLNRAEDMAAVYGMSTTSTIADAAIRRSAELIGPSIGRMVTPAGSTQVAEPRWVMQALSEHLQGRTENLVGYRLGASEIDSIAKRVEVLALPAQQADPESAWQKYAPTWLGGAAAALPQLLIDWKKHPPLAIDALRQAAIALTAAPPSTAGEAPAEGLGERIALPPRVAPRERPRDEEKNEPDRPTAIRNAAEALRDWARRPTDIERSALTGEERLFLISIDKFADHIANDGPSTEESQLNKIDFARLREAVRTEMVTKHPRTNSATLEPVMFRLPFEFEALSHGNPRAIDVLHDMVNAAESTERKLLNSQFATEIRLPEAVEATRRVRPDGIQGPLDLLNFFRPIVENLQLRQRMRIATGPVVGGNMPAAPYNLGGFTRPTLSFDLRKRWESSMQVFFPIIGMELLMANAEEWGGHLDVGWQHGLPIGPDTKPSQPWTRGAWSISVSMGRARVRTRQQGTGLRFFRFPNQDDQMRKKMVKAMTAMLLWEDLVDAKTQAPFAGPLEAVLAHCPDVSIFEADIQSRVDEGHTNLDLAIGLNRSSIKVDPNAALAIDMPITFQRLGNTRQEQGGQTRINHHEENTLRQLLRIGPALRFGFGRPTQDATGDLAKAPHDGPGSVRINYPGLLQVARDVMDVVQRNGLSAHQIANDKQDADLDRHEITPDIILEELDRNAEMWLARAIEKLPPAQDEQQRADNWKTANEQMVAFRAGIVDLGKNNPLVTFNVNRTLQSKMAGWIDGLRATGALAELAGDDDAALAAAVSRDNALNETATWRELMLIARERGTDAMLSGINYFIQAQQRASVETQRTALQYPPEPPQVILETPVESADGASQDSMPAN